MATEAEAHEQGVANITFNITVLPDDMISEFLDRSHDHDLLALLSSCKTFKRVLAIELGATTYGGAKVEASAATGKKPRVVRRPPDSHVVNSAALLAWAFGNGWAWPTSARVRSFR